jgi:hypothetical protein
MPACAGMTAGRRSCATWRGNFAQGAGTANPPIA